MLTQVIILTLFPAVMAFAASSDLLTMTIANRVSLILVGGFVLLAVLTGMSPVAVAWHFAAGAAVLALTFVMFSCGWVGGGDAKLAAATALWFGFAHLLDYLVYASVLGGALTLALIQFRMLPLPAPLAGANGSTGCIGAAAACRMASRSRRRHCWSIRTPNG